MKKTAYSFFILFTMIFAPSIHAEDEGTFQEPVKSQEPFKPFTGLITKNKVRLRIQPSLESKIVRELNRGDLLIVNGEDEDFYKVQPPANLKAYIFRTYVLDNVVEGNRINVRLEPDADAPVIAQLNSGDRVRGTISSQNNKWLEIDVPSSASLYISKEYIENIGDPSVMAKTEKRRDEVNHLLNSTSMASQTEMQKSFDLVNLNGVVANYQKLIKDYPDFPDQAARAKEQLKALQEEYLKKKVAYLESRQNVPSEELKSQNQAQKDKISQLENQLKIGKISKPSDTITSKMSAWIPLEEEFMATWQENNEGSKEAFYEQQRDDAISIRGIVEVYDRPVKNKPGDYVLMNKATNLPIAYLYSTHINLQDLVGHETTLMVSPRPNNHFAFPAYFVLSLE